MGVLLQGTAVDILWSSLGAAVGVAAIAAGAGGWIRRAATPIERTLAIAAGCLLLVPRPATSVAGAALLGGVIAAHSVRGVRLQPDRDRT